MIDFPSNPELIPIAGLYAETHYRFRFFPFSRYFKHEAEVIFDTPFRIEPDTPLPVSIIIKDANQYPLRLIDVCFKASIESEHADKTFQLNTDIKIPLWYQIFELDVSSLPAGKLTVTARARLSDGRNTWEVNQDNHSLLSQAPFKVHNAADPLPGFSGWSAGELHCHSEYGCDHVEFGAPLEMYQQMAPAMGLKWIAVTDHSYNLDDMPEDYLTDDPELRKWADFLERIDVLNNSGNGALLLPGEELTCRSESGKNIHLLVIDNTEFLHGSGDGAQKWLLTRSENSVPEALEKIKNTSFTAAAHPLVPVNWLQRLLVKRGKWGNSDLNEKRIDGWQICNGMWDIGFTSGLKKWIGEINRGKRINIYAGNDAHGNFNRFRQVKIPMLTLHENSDHLFGKITTRIRVADKYGKSEIINNLKDGKSYISDGPAIELSIFQKNKTLFSGDIAEKNATGSIRLRYKTSQEFGQLKLLRILGGSSNGEITIRQYNPKSDPFCKLFEGEISSPLIGSKYIRAEIETITSSGKTHRAFANPIWF